MLNQPDRNCMKENIVRIKESFPTADVVEVVRCRNCNHKVDFGDRIMCSRNATKNGGEWYGLTAVTNEHYCGYGERSDT